jgi:hypothetical protein
MLKKEPERNDNDKILKKRVLNINQGTNSSEEEF